MLRSDRHVVLNTAETAASSGRAAATMVLITSGGKSVNLARELLVTTMMLEAMLLHTSAELVRPRVHLAGPGSPPERGLLLPMHHGALLDGVPRICSC